MSKASERCSCPDNRKTGRGAKHTLVETEGSSSESLPTLTSQSLSQTLAKEQNSAPEPQQSLDERNVCSEPCPKVRRLEKFLGLLAVV